MEDRKEWLAERRKGIGGSDISAILGINPYKSKRDLALEKLGLLPEPEINPAMQRGIKLEPLVADMFQEVTGIEVVEEKRILVHPDHPWMLGNIDRWANPSGTDFDRAVLEIKCPGMAVFSKIRREGLPDHFITQLQWYLSITGMGSGFFAVFNSEIWKLEHFQVEADTELQTLMIAEAEKFWNDLQYGIIPDDTPGPVIDLPAASSHEILKIDTPEWTEAVRELQEADEILKEAEELKESAKITIKNLMGGFDIAEGGGLRVYNRLTNGRTSIDAKRLKKELPDVYARFAKQGEPLRTFKSYVLKGLI